MALGNMYNNNQKKDTSPSVYSYYRMSNPTSSVDQTNLTFTYWKGLLKISIAPRKQTTDDTIAFDYDAAISIHLSYTKASILANEIREFLSGTDKNIFNRGVSTPKGCIYICDGSEFKSKNPCLVIKLVAEDGSILSSIAYEFNTNYHFSIRNFDEVTKNFDKEFNSYNTQEINELLAVLDTYVQSVTNATAYSVVDSLHYTHDRLSNNISAIAEKLGVETGKKSANSYSSKSSFFNTASGGSTLNAGKASTTTYDYDNLDLD